MSEVLLAEPEDESAEALLATYESAVAAALEGRDPEETAAEAGLEAEVARAAAEGEAGDLDLRDVATLLAAAGESVDADALLADVRDAVLLEMSTAMLTVDRVALEVDGDLDPKEVQGMLEGRLPMTLSEYARLRHYIAGAG